MAERIVQLKEEGNGEFKAKNTRRALELYSEAIALFESPGGEVDRGAQHRLRAEVLGNRCRCFMLLGRYGEALEDAKQATCVDASYTKGFYRLALCQKDPSDGCLGG
ncbi:unnamed protein product [Durusdinium trenchii]|uniref:Uncharacterized protein n=2 Tax=Durusdinium trenchii TaxID=1381693 RepID=A0ABP0PHV1_9DINO